MRVSPGPELGFSADPCTQLPPEALPTPFFLGQKAMPCPGPEAGSGSHVCVGTVSGPELASVLREGPWTFSLEAPLAWPKLEAPWGWLTLHAECEAAEVAPDPLLGVRCVPHACVGVPVWQGAAGARACG